MATSDNSKGQGNRTSRQVLSVPTAWGAQYQGLTPSKGLPNGSVLCYRNSALMFLLYSPVLVNWLASHYGGNGCEVPCIRCQLHRLVVSFWEGACDGDNKETALDRVWETLMEGAWKGKNVLQQQDVREFIESLFEQIRRETPDEECFEMNDILKITVGTNWECKECGQTWVGEPYQGYFCTAQFPQDLASTEFVNIEDMLSSCFSGSFAEYACENCNCAQRFRTEAITNIPEILLVHLNRVGPNDNLKRLTPVALGEQIALPESMRRCLVDTAEIYYELYSVIFHNDRRIDQGHYIAAAKTPTGHWAVISDDKEWENYESLGKLLKGGTWLRTPPIMAYVCAYRRLPLEGGPASLGDYSNPPQVGESAPPVDVSTPARVGEPASSGEVLDKAQAMALDEVSPTDLAATVPQPEIALSPLMSPSHRPVRPGVTMGGTISLSGRDTVWTMQQHLPMPSDAGPLIKLKPNGRVQHASIRLVFTSGEEVLEGNATISLKPRTSRTQKQEPVKTMNTKKKKTGQTTKKSKKPTSREQSKPQSVRKPTSTTGGGTEFKSKSTKNTRATRQKKVKEPTKKTR